MSFGKKLRIIRKEMNLTQTEMGERLLMDQSTYSRYESEKTYPTIEIVTRVSKVFSIDIGWLLQIKDDYIRNKKNVKNSSDNNMQREIIEFLIEQKRSVNDLLNKLQSK